LKGRALNPAWRASHKCIDLYFKCHYIYSKPGRRLQHRARL
jgi:hypothetical protein